MKGFILPPTLVSVSYGSISLLNTHIALRKEWAELKEALSYIIHRSSDKVRYEYLVTGYEVIDKRTVLGVLYHELSYHVEGMVVSKGLNEDDYALLLECYGMREEERDGYFYSQAAILDDSGFDIGTCMGEVPREWDYIARLIRSGMSGTVWIGITHTGNVHLHVTDNGYVQDVRPIVENRRYPLTKHWLPYRELWVVNGSHFFKHMYSVLEEVLPNGYRLP